MAQFCLPDLGEGLEEAQLVQWLVKTGEPVQLNQPICQVETAKALVDIPSPFAGTVATLHASPGDTVPVGAVLIEIEQGEAGGGAATTHAPRATDAEGASGAVLVGYGTEGPPQTFTRRRRHATPGSTTMPATSGTHTNGATARATTKPASNGSGVGASSAAASAAPALSDAGVKASPLVRKMAAQHDIDLYTIRGTGPGGRIRVEDLPATYATSATPVATPIPADEDIERISTVGLRKAIAAKMVRSATTIPHFNAHQLFDASALAAIRKRLQGEGAFAATHLTYLPFFVRALAAAVKRYPVMNSRWDDEGNAILINHRVHVGIATDTPRGLLVPVVRNAQQSTLAEIAAECARLVARARAGTLDAASLTGSTITITNVGAAGPADLGAPLINPPEVCVVAFNAIKPRPTVVGDHLEVRPGAWISIACDHRVVDGATAAQFLGTLVEALEAPEALAAQP